MFEQSLCKVLNIKEWKLFELQINQTWPPPHAFRKKKMSKFNTRKKWENIYQMCTKWKVNIFNVWTIIRQILDIKE